VDIGDFLRVIASEYDTSTVSSRGHLLLKQSADYLKPLIPAGLIISHGGGQGTATFTPWIAILDPDETTSAQRGIYLVYIFNVGLTKVTLTLNQGITDRSTALGRKEAKRVLRSDAEVLRATLTSSELVKYHETFVLGGTGFRQAAYEAGNILSKTYEIADLPSSEDLERDLDQLTKVYQDVLLVRQSLLQTKPGLLNLGNGSTDGLIQSAVPEFKPKSDSDYLQHVSERTIVKTRRHETLIREYGKFAKGLGFVVNTNVHPRDLTMSHSNSEWLVEAKVVYNGNSTSAVREAIGQLQCYEFFHYSRVVTPKLALFTENIGDAYVELLESLGIASVWKGSLSWEGSKSAVLNGLV